VHPSLAMRKKDGDIIAVLLDNIRARDHYNDTINLDGIGFESQLCNGSIPSVKADYVPATVDLDRKAVLQTESRTPLHLKFVF
jgi:hypothetical protein